MSNHEASELAVVQRLTRIETMLETALKSQGDKIVRLESLVDKLSTRIDSLEKFRWVIVGAAMAGGGLTGAAVERILGG